MKFIYPAILSKKEAGGYCVRLPDLTGCFAEGDSIDEAMENANAAALDWITLELEEDLPLPAVSEPGDLVLSEGDELRNVCVNYRFSDGWEE